MKLIFLKFGKIFKDFHLLLDKFFPSFNCNSAFIIVFDPTLKPTSIH